MKAEKTENPLYKGRDVVLGACYKFTCVIPKNFYTTPTADSIYVTLFDLLRDVSPDDIDLYSVQDIKIEDHESSVSVTFDVLNNMEKFDISACSKFKNGMVKGLYVIDKAKWSASDIEKIEKQPKIVSFTLTRKQVTPITEVTSDDAQTFTYFTVPAAYPTVMKEVLEKLLAAGVKYRAISYLGNLAVVCRSKDAALQANLDSLLSLLKKTVREDDDSSDYKPDAITVVQDDALVEFNIVVKILETSSRSLSDSKIKYVE